MLDQISLLNTIEGSRFEGFFPTAWDLDRIDNCCSRKPEEVYERESWWHKDFLPVCGESLSEFNTLMGHEIAYQIKLARDEGRDLILILSAGPMGMYYWAAKFLTTWGVEKMNWWSFHRFTRFSGVTFPVNMVLDPMVSISLKEA